MFRGGLSLPQVIAGIGELKWVALTAALLLPETFLENVPSFLELETIVLELY